MQAVLGIEAAVLVHHEPALIVTTRMQPALNAFDQPDIFDLQNLVDILDRLHFAF